MKLKFKIWLLLSALLSVVLAIDLTFSYKKLEAETRKEAEYDARTIYGFMMATRRIYQQQFIASGLPVNEKTLGFLPAHSFSRISHDFANWNQSGIIFNNVTDRPRNPDNQADRFELEAMNWFAANPKANERMRDIVNDNGIGYMLYTAPIRIEPFCLKCHGERDAAPTSIRDRYAAAYGYKVGDMRGVVSIRIPTEKFQERLLRLWGGRLVKSLIGYAAIFLALGFILDWLVTRRLSRLQEGAQRIAAGEYETRVQRQGNDEIGGLAETFNRMTDAVENRVAEIHNLAYFDPLTNLPNRRLLMDRLGQALIASNRSGAFGALLILDLDNFKNLNDTLGHDIGDQLLIEVAHRLTANVRQEDTVSRLGGDEYVVMLEGLSLDEQSAANQAEMIAEKVRLALSTPYALEGVEQLHRSTASIGMTLFHGLNDSTDVLLKQADVALYQAKDAGRNKLRFFNPAMQAAIDTRTAMESALRQALSKNEFLLYYQPQVDEYGRVVGAEALLRWLRPGMETNSGPNSGMVSPADFIPLAEETGLILPIGEWVLHTACAQLMAWAGDARTRDLQLAINVSARQFHQIDFVHQISACLARSGVNPSRLKLELTESVVLDNVEDVIRRMQEIKALGVNFSLDDFGTGYSSLSYLKRLPLDQIKIDQSFVRDLTVDANDAAIVRAILAMSQSLGLNVIAEGVETQAQHDFLHANGCKAFQGYLFGKPMPIAEWANRL